MQLINELEQLKENIHSVIGSMAVEGNDISRERYAEFHDYAHRLIWIIDGNTEHLKQIELIKSQARVAEVKAELERLGGKVC